VQGRLLAVTLPEMITSPFQHSGLCGQRAVADRTDVAGQPLLTVGIPNTPGVLPGEDPVCTAGLDAGSDGLGLAP
jgi:hypothetical protein